MSLFKRKKINRPKNPLGLALLQYDCIINKDLKKIIDKIKSGRLPDTAKIIRVFNESECKLDRIIEYISKENLKIDYRSDKARYMIIDMIESLKTLFKTASSHGFEEERISRDRNLLSMEQIFKAREDLKSYMKDIESDYL
ncbi:MAG: hypothetical protein JW770_07420 [Actinobacteria bacterium]|nr:hypothetical protein [Actinomycetota bacterium]